MRTINAQEYIKKNKERFSRNRLRLISRTPEKPVKRRPRDKEEEKILIRLTGLRWEKWQKEGIIKKVGVRKFQVKIF